jgi:putative DNA primase/helicase
VLTECDRANLASHAQKSLQSLTLEALKQDPGLAFHPDSIRAFAALKSYSPAEWARWKATLRRAGVPLRDLNRQMTPARAKLRVVERGTTGPRTVSTMLGAGCPGATLIVPEAYSLAAEATSLLDDSDESQPRQINVAYAPVLITRRLQESETGWEFLELAWCRDGKWHDLIRDRGLFMDPRKLITLASLGFPVAGDNAAKLSTYLHKFEAENHSNLPCSLTTSHLGWQGAPGGEGFLWGQTMIGPNGIEANTIQFQGRAEGDGQIAAGYHSAGQFEKWLDCVRGLRRFRGALVVLYTAFVSCLLQILRAPNFILDICGATSVGKTTLLRLAASVWGCPDELQPNSAIHTWDVTPVWAERASAVISGLPLILDETKRARNAQLIQNMVYMVASGQGRGRGNVESLDTTRSWNTVLLSSGEAPITSYSQAGGTRTRCLEFRGLPFDAQDDTAGMFARNISASVRSNYGYAGPAFVRYLLRQRCRWDELRFRYAAEIARYSAMVPGRPEADRLAQAFATIATAVPFVHDALNLPWDFQEGVASLDQIWPDILGEGADAVGAKRALRGVIAWARAHAATFYTQEPAMIAPPGGWSGLWDSKSDWEYVAFYEPVIKDVLHKLEYEPEAILFEWKSRGWLDTRRDRPSSYLRQVDIPGGKRPYMVAILRKFIEEVEDES